MCFYLKPLWYAPADLYILSKITLEHLEFGDGFNGEIQSLHGMRMLTYLKFGEGFNQPIDHLRGLTMLRTLIFGDDFKGAVTALQNVPRLNYLKLGTSHTKNDVKDLPQDFTKLIYGGIEHIHGSPNRRF